MSLEIKGKVIAILPLQSGQGKNGEWKSQDFVIETIGTYTKKVCINLYGDKLTLMPNIDETVNAHIELESREYNGRWYTSARAWKIEKEVNVTVAPSTPLQAPAASEGSDLPF